jgi:hypothetical protein
LADLSLVFAAHHTEFWNALLRDTRQAWEDGYEPQESKIAKLA